MAAPRGPVILADIADSGAGGTAGDATVTFKTLLDLGARNAAVCSISDQEAINICLAAGVGAEVSMLVGGSATSSTVTRPVTGTVRLIHRLLRAAGTYGPWCAADSGPLRGARNWRRGIELMLTEHRAHPNDLQYFRAFGIEPTERQMLVLKSARYRAAFDPMLSRPSKSMRLASRAHAWSAIPTKTSAGRSIHWIKYRSGKSPPVPSPTGRGSKGLKNASVDQRRYLPNHCKAFPPIHRGMLPVGRTIHREEAVTGIVIHVELVSLPPLFEFLFGFRNILRRRAPVLPPKQPKQGTAQVLRVVDRGHGLTRGEFLRLGDDTTTVAVNRGVDPAACTPLSTLAGAGAIANDAHFATEIRQGAEIRHGPFDIPHGAFIRHAAGRTDAGAISSGVPLPSRKCRLGEMAT